MLGLSSAHLEEAAAACQDAAEAYGACATQLVYEIDECDELTTLHHALRHGPVDPGIARSLARYSAADGMSAVQVCTNL